MENFLQKKLAVNDILKCNETTSRFGLVLTQTDAEELLATRSEALLNCGRVEFGTGAVGKIIMAFCDSPFLMRENYAETLNELVETFYYFKNETLDLIGDDDLISFMKKHFNKNCKGCVELLQSRELEKLAHDIRFEIDGDESDEEDESEEDDDE